MLQIKTKIWKNLYDFILQTTSEAESAHGEENYMFL